jgi:hypothetical protein
METLQELSRESRPLFFKLHLAIVAGFLACAALSAGIQRQWTPADRTPPAQTAHVAQSR